MLQALSIKNGRTGPAAPVTLPECPPAPLALRRALAKCADLSAKRAALNEELSEVYRALHTAESYHPSRPAPAGTAERRKVLEKELAALDKQLAEARQTVEATRKAFGPVIERWIASEAKSLVAEILEISDRAELVAAKLNRLSDGAASVGKALPHNLAVANQGLMQLLRRMRMALRK